jgi:hypothetical protein
MHPDPAGAAGQRPPLIGLAHLMTRAFAGDDLAPLGAQLIARAQASPGDGAALMDLATILQIRGQRDLALDLHRRAIDVQQLYRLPAPAGRAGLRLLALMGPGDVAANTPVEFLMDGLDVALDLLYLAPGHPFPQPVPEHDVAFVAIGECDDNLPLLRQLENVLVHWPRPVLNAPERIAGLSRDRAYARLKGAPGVRMPASVRCTRASLEQIAAGTLPLTGVLPDGAYPVIIRPVGSHAGHGLIKAGDRAAIAGYLAGMPDQEFYIARFIDYSDGDGLYRKYRVVLIDGVAYAGHMAISPRWMIHYLNAEMTESAAHRAEEAQFMAGFESGFGRRHAAALAAINDRIGLDYLTIDCAEADGALLVFEVDSGAVIHAMDPVDLFPYKRPQMRKVFAAFRAMLEKAAQRKPSPT